MPTLVYPTGDFQPFTKILSSDVNGKFNAVTTLLNTTKLDSTNVQQYGLTRDRLAADATPSSIVINDGSGNISSTLILPTTQGGTGINYTPSAADVTKVLQVNAAGTAFTVGTSPIPPALNIFSFYRYG